MLLKSDDRKGLGVEEGAAEGDIRGLLGLEKAAKLWEEMEGVMDDLMAGMEGEGVRREGLVSAGNDWEGVRPLTVDDVAAAVAVGGGENITSGLYTTQ